MVRAVLCMNQIMLMTKKAAASMTQPSKMSELNWVWARTMAPTTLAAMAEPRAQKTVRLSSVSADLGQVGEDDADDQRRFDAFAEGDDKCLQHKVFLFPEAGAWASDGCARQGLVYSGLNWSSIEVYGLIRGIDMGVHRGMGRRAHAVGMNAQMIRSGWRELLFVAAVGGAGVLLSSVRVWAGTGDGSAHAACGEADGWADGSVGCGV